MIIPAAAVDEPPPKRPCPIAKSALIDPTDAAAPIIATMIHKRFPFAFDFVFEPPAMI